MNKLELLAPAGDLEKLKFALIYGADAVYFGGEDFSLRSGAGGLTIEEMGEGIDFCHTLNKKAYLTLNIFAHNQDIEPIRDYLKSISGLNLDGILVSDPGILYLVKEIVPHVDLHLSTQANMTNYLSAMFWRDFGLKRLVLARELSFSEIREIRDILPQDVELEAFIHGAMCISYSGRCLLSNVMTGRDANQGECAHPCRYKYSIMEEMRPGEYYPIEEDDRGTYIMNSKDLSMINHIPDIINSGISSAKIEGRNKSVYYVATVVKAYRKAIDSYYDNPIDWSCPKEILDELMKASHRDFTTGFYYDKPANESQNYESSAYIKDYTFLGIVNSYEEGRAIVQQRNKFSIGDQVEIFGPDETYFTQEIKEIIDLESGERIDSCPHPKQRISINVDKPVETNYLIRRKDK